MASSFILNRQAAHQYAVDHLSEGLNKALDEMVQIAVKHAPSRKHTRKNKSERTRREVAVQAIHENYIPDRIRYKQIENKRYKAKTIAPVSSIRKFREYISTVTAGHKPYSKEYKKIYSEYVGLAAKSALRSRGGADGGSGSFTFKFVAKKTGQEINPRTTNLGISRDGGLKVGTGVVGGNLKSKISRTALTVDGLKVSGAVRSDAPYSRWVEYGFMHKASKGGTATRVPAQSFMRPAKKDFESRWRSFFKKG